MQASTATSISLAHFLCHCFLSSANLDIQHKHRTRETCSTLFSGSFCLRDAALGVS